MKKYDIFISYSSENQKTVEAICAYLEQHKIRCFVAYRDIPVTRVWAEAIVEAIENSRMMLVVFSAEFNKSKQVDREIELASESQLPIFTFRISNDEFQGAKKYYLKNLHWIDAYPNPEEKFHNLLVNVAKLLDVKITEPSVSQLNASGEQSQKRPYKNYQKRINTYFLANDYELPTGNTSAQIKHSGFWRQYKRYSWILVGLACVLGVIFLPGKSDSDGYTATAPQDSTETDSPVITEQFIEFKIFHDILHTEMVAVDGGTFTMGATSEQGSDYDSDELPTHEVTLSDFYIGKYEVTQQLWEYVMNYTGTCADGSAMSAYASDVWLGSNPSTSYGLGSEYPAYYVSWEDIVNIFIPRLNKITGKKFRLPTEAEWEYVARGGNQSQGYKYSGSNTIGDVAWYYNNSASSTHPVGTKQPNELGIYDMSGNVYEWCSDWHGSYTAKAQTNPIGPSTGSPRVLRGGSWDYDAQYCRVSSRSNNPGYPYCDVGFRLALSR